MNDNKTRRISIDHFIQQFNFIEINSRIWQQRNYCSTSNVTMVNFFSSMRRFVFVCCLLSLLFSLLVFFLLKWIRWWRRRRRRRTPFSMSPLNHILTRLIMLTIQMSFLFQPVSINIRRISHLMLSCVYIEILLTSSLLWSTLMYLSTAEQLCLLVICRTQPIREHVYQLSWLYSDRNYREVIEIHSLSALFVLCPRKEWQRRQQPKQTSFMDKHTCLYEDMHETKCFVRCLNMLIVEQGQTETKSSYRL
jgi:hypothetical protein